MYRCLAKTAFSAVLCFLFQGQLSAQDCTNIPSVQISQFVTHNSEYGGHLNAHVYGQTPPNGYTQLGKTLFRDADDWEDAYNKLVEDTPPLQCINADAARTLPAQYLSYKCTAVDANERCTEKNEIQTRYVTYVLRRNGDNKWILYTAYPSINP